MRVLPLHRDSDSDYSCVAYWVLGDHNRPEDRNTLVDAGSSNLSNLAFYMREMAEASKGIGKMAVEQVILTHGHFDHSGGLPGVEKQFAPDTWAWLPAGARYRKALDGAHLRVGDQDAVILYTPGHSDDSICIYMPAARSLFSGDTVFRISDGEGSYSPAYVESLDRLGRLDIDIVYPGHGSPIEGDIRSFIRECGENVRKALGRR